MSRITTHILDTSRGRPAEGVTVFLLRRKDEEWIKVATAATDSDGRIGEFTSEELEAGVYKLRFLTREYFSHRDIRTFYPYVEIVFEAGPSEHYHVPLLLTPFGFTTYRGS